MGATKAAVTAALGVVLLSGCGVQILLKGPSVAGPNASVTYELGLKNPSACPIGGVNAEVSPFSRPGDIDVEGDDPFIVELFESLFGALCAQQTIELPDGITCRIEEDELVCEREDAQGTPGGGSATASLPNGTRLSCEREGGSIRCQISSGTSGGTAGITSDLMCAETMDGLHCDVDRIEPGETASTTFQLTAPSTPGLYRTFVFAYAFATGVCKDGMNAGDPCGGDGDCPSSTCEPGICTSNTSDATSGGCEDDGDCLITEHCVQCGPGSDMLFLPLACQQITVQMHAPILSPLAMFGSILAIFAVRFWRVLRRRED